MKAIELIPDSPRIAEYYFTYGLALARTNQCGEALQIAQLIISRVPADELSVENANAIISRCEANLSTPPATGTPALPAGAESTPTP
jgi:hypothetical protein